MNSSTPSTTCTYSLATDPRAPSDHRPASAISTPKTTSVHSAAVSVATTTGDSAVSAPITTAAQSCQRRHVRLVIATIPFRRNAPILNLDWPAGQELWRTELSVPAPNLPVMDDRLAYD